MTGLQGTLGWGGIARLGIVQMSLGAAVVLMTSTLNRVMVVELALPASVPGALVALHFLVQILRAPLGFGSDVTGRRTPWIIGGMAVLALGCIAATGAVALTEAHRTAGIALAALAFSVIGVGVGASGTSLLALVSERVASTRRASAAALLWIMMIAGIAVTAGVAGAMLDPFSMQRLLVVSATVSLVAFALTVIAVYGIEREQGVATRVATPAPDDARRRFAESFQAVWTDARIRRFAMFVFASMLAYSAQDLILEPFAGSVFLMTPGESTALAGLQHGGVLAGMLVAAVIGSRFGTLTQWAVGGCIASAGAFTVLAMTPAFASVGMLKMVVFALGAANGVFAVGAIGTMMMLTAADDGHAGLRMGVFGASQAIAYAGGGLLGAALSDIGRAAFGSPATAYALVFVIEAGLFLAAALFAARTPAGAEVRVQALRTRGDAILSAIK